MEISFIDINSFSKIVLNKTAKVTYWQCCLKWKPGEANIFYALPLTSAWGRTIDFNVLFPIYTLLIIRWYPKEITQHEALVRTIFYVY
jgi:hypothetical protein